MSGSFAKKSLVYLSWVLAVIAFLIAQPFYVFIFPAYQNWQGTEQRAVAGDAISQRTLGVGYHTGRIHIRSLLDEQDDDKAIYWYQRAASQGDGTACYLLGRLYESRKEYPLALTWHTEGARLRNQSAKRRLAEVYSQGLLGQAVDKRKAERLRRQSIRVKG